MTARFLTEDEKQLTAKCVRELINTLSNFTEKNIAISSPEVIISSTVSFFVNMCIRTANIMYRKNPSQQEITNFVKHVNEALKILGIEQTNPLEEIRDK